MFADKYLIKNNNKPLLKRDAEKEVGIIVVIPCLREPDLLQTLTSLKNCSPTSSKVEVLVLINHSELADEQTKEINFGTKNEAELWIKNNPVEGISFYIIGPLELKKKWAGAGLARKNGMDEAVRRFNLIEKPDGVIVSLDADTLVPQNYLFEIERYFSNNPQKIGATIAFEHQKKGLEKKQLEGIELYEEYLKYYKEALDFTGYPYSMFTIGSAFAVRALDYVKRGGMNRRQAGEDFYFLQNLVQVGEVGEITNTKVFPSARLSDRVPFGTGPILQKWMIGEEDLTQTYNFNAFEDLQQVFITRDKFYQVDEREFLRLIDGLNKPIKDFIVHDNFWRELEDLNKNCATLDTFQNRFFQKFNAFKILKYLNFSHDKYYKKEDLKTQFLLLNQKKQA